MPRWQRRGFFTPPVDGSPSPMPTTCRCVRAGCRSAGQILARWTGGASVRLARQPSFQVAVLGFAFLFVFTGYFTIQSFGAKLYNRNDPSLTANMMTVLSGSFVVRVPRFLRGSFVVYTGPQVVHSWSEVPTWFVRGTVWVPHPLFMQRGLVRVCLSYQPCARRLIAPCPCPQLHLPLAAS